MIRRLILMFLMMIFLMPALAMAKDFNVTLSWDANTEPDLAGYKVYMSTESGVYSIPVEVLGLQTTYEGQVDVPEDKITTYYWVVTAYDIDNLESDYSNEVSHTFDTRVPPAPPKNLSWFERIIAWIKNFFKWV